MGTFDSIKKTKEMDSNLGKRRAPTELKADGKGGFEYIDKEEVDTGRESTASEIAARKILKIRRGGKMLDEDTCKTAENNANAPKCTIGQALPTFNQNTNAAETSFITKQSNSPQKQGVSLFSNNNNNNGAASFFNNNNSTTTSIFSNNNNATGTSIFGKKEEDNNNKPGH